MNICGRFLRLIVVALLMASQLPVHARGGGGGHGGGGGRMSSHANRGMRGGQRFYGGYGYGYGRGGYGYGGYGYGYGYGNGYGSGYQPGYNYDAWTLENDLRRSRLGERETVRNYSWPATATAQSASPKATTKLSAKTQAQPL